MRKIRAFDPTAQEYDQLPPASILTKKRNKIDERRPKSSRELKNKQLHRTDACMVQAETRRKAGPGEIWSTFPSAEL
jgi:hypothetical protein